MQVSLRSVYVSKCLLMHVTLSGIKNLEDISLICKYNSNAVKANASARLEYERLKNKSFLGCYQCLIS